MTAAIIALYRRAGSAASDYFTERVGIYVFDGGQDEEYAVQQAHKETVEWMQRYLGQLTGEELELTRQINAMERDMRKRRIKPEFMPSTELSEMDNAMMAAELLERLKPDGGKYVESP